MTSLESTSGCFSLVGGFTFLLFKLLSYRQDYYYQRTNHRDEVIVTKRMRENNSLVCMSPLNNSIIL